MPIISPRDEVFAYAEREYGSPAEFLWARFPYTGIVRRADNRKWYGIVMRVSREKLGLPGPGEADVLNVKPGDPLLLDELLRRPGYLPAYHMAKGSWVSVLLDGSVPLADIARLLDLSYGAVAPRVKAGRRSGPGRH